MPYKFKVIFSGLCLYHLPNKLPLPPGRDPEERYRDDQVLLVNATQSRLSVDRITHLHRHTPRLVFRPEDLDDFSLNPVTREPDFSLIPSPGGDHLGFVELLGREVSFLIDERDEAKNPFTN